MSIICKQCGEENSNESLICVICGSQLKNESSNNYYLILSETYLGTKIKISETGCLGRSDETHGPFIGEELFVNDCYVGRPQCKFFLENGCWYIEAISAVNSTDILIPTANGKYSANHLSIGVKYKLNDNELIRIPHHIFKVSFEPVSEEPTVNTDSKPDEQKSIWVIECPICHEEYIVDNENSRINECTKGCKNLTQPFYRKQIAEVFPRLMKK